MTDRIARWHEFLRLAELDLAIENFPSDKNIRILEIGGRDGYQARHLVDLGYQHITSIDVEPLSPQYYPVQQTTGSDLNFDSQSFDMIFTSHVVAHIVDVDKSLQEMNRVTTDDATLMHVVPTTTWTVITNLVHYVRLAVVLPVRAWRKLFSRKTADETASPSLEADCEHDSTGRIKRAGLKYLLLNPLGENPSFVHELYLFSGRGWRELFAKHGLKVVNVTPGPHLYSGYSVFAGRMLGIRSILGRLGFSGSSCFVLKKSA